VVVVVNAKPQLLVQVLMAAQVVEVEQLIVVVLGGLLEQALVGKVLLVQLLLLVMAVAVAVEQAQ
jgi:hypothetical protein